MGGGQVTSVFAQPDAVRELPQLLPAAGWSLAEVRSECVSEVGGEASYWVSFAEGYLPRYVAPQEVSIRSCSTCGCLNAGQHR